MSNKVMFSPKISRKVLDELVGDGKVTTIKLEILEIIKDVIIGVLEFTVFEEGPRHVGDASFVGDAFYREMRPRGCLTPSRMNKKQLFK